MSDSAGLATDDAITGPTSGLRYVHLRSDWATELEQLEHVSFPTADPDSLYKANDFSRLAKDFSAGCYVGFDGDNLVAAGLGLRLNFDFDHPQHTIHDIVGDDSSGHDDNGLWYYGTDIVVRPEYRRRGIGKELYGLRKDVCRKMNLAGIVAGGVIPGYADHKHEMSADDYIVEVTAGRLYDPTLSFQLHQGFVSPCALHDYIDDPAVDGHAALIVWHNPEYNPD